MQIESLHSIIEHALAASGIAATVRALHDLSGGCIHRVVRVALRDGRDVVAKINRASMLPLFEEEALGLRLLASTNTVHVPQPLIVTQIDNHAVLLMTAIHVVSHASDMAWQRFGEDLAALHRSSQTPNQYGFERDNHIGAMLQPNAWSEDWVEFNRVNRLGFQLQLAIDNGLLDAGDADAVHRVIDALGAFIPRQPPPALLHGDLWSGNVITTVNHRIAVIDPACSIGDGWADIAMMRLFGGFPERCFETYAAHVTDHEQIDDRIAVYQLYHVLNHLNLFGNAYRGQVRSICDTLLKS